jgi:hypothetical protein
MFTGNVVNNGINNGTVAGLIVNGNVFNAGRPGAPLFFGNVVNNGINNGLLTGAIVNGSIFR